MMQADALKVAQAVAVMWWFLLQSSLQCGIFQECVSLCPASHLTLCSREMLRHVSYSLSLMPDKASFPHRTRLRWTWRSLCGRTPGSTPARFLPTDCCCSMQYFVRHLVRYTVHEACDH